MKGSERKKSTVLSFIGESKKSPGTLWSCGYNKNGALGRGTTLGQSQSTFGQVGALTSWAKVAAGTSHWLAIQSNGTLWGCGYAAYGQLGQGANTANQNSPVQIGTLSTWVQCSGQSLASFAIKNDGTLWACGYNGTWSGLGTNSSTQYGVTSLVQVGTGSNWAQISASNTYAMALQSNGTLWGWGNNSYGQLGNNSFSGLQNISSPVQIGNLSTWTSIFAGSGPSTIGLQNNAMFAFGANTTGQLGQGNTINYSSPVQIGPSTTGSNYWTNLATGVYTTIAIQSPGTLWVWGNNSYGQLGQSDLIHRSTPTQIGTLSNWIQISSGASFNASILRNIASPNFGTLWSWGRNDVGQLGQNNIINYSSPVQVGALTTWLSVACGYGFTQAIKNDNTLWSWGLNSFGQLGQGNQINYSSPVQVGALSTWDQVSCGYAFTVALQKNGTLWAWGSNTIGQLGQNNIINYSSPVQVGVLSVWSSIGPGQTFTSARQINGTLWSWGNNTFGQLGLYNPAAYSLTNYPSQFNTGNFNKVTASNSQSYFRRTADNTIVQTSTVDIPTIDTTNSIAWASYDTGQYHFVGVQTNGTAWSIGNNSYGQLGLNTTTSSYSSLTQIGSGTNWSRAIAADYGSMLIDNSNNAWVFGNNNQYQLGLSDTINRSSPVQITYATGIRNAAMDNNDIWLVDGNNNLWGGGVGNKVSANTTTNFTYPTQKFTSNFWSNVTTNQDSTLLVGTNSIVYGFGNNTYGQLGLGANTNTYQYSPVQIGSINTTVKVETKAGSSIILFK